MGRCSKAMLEKNLQHLYQDLRTFLQQVNQFAECKHEDAFSSEMSDRIAIVIQGLNLLLKADTKGIQAMVSCSYRRIMRSRTLSEIYVDYLKCRAKARSLIVSVLQWASDLEELTEHCRIAAEVAQLKPFVIDEVEECLDRTAPPVKSITRDARTSEAYRRLQRKISKHLWQSSRSGNGDSLLSAFLVSAAILGIADTVLTHIMRPVHHTLESAFGIGDSLSDLPDQLNLIPQPGTTHMEEDYEAVLNRNLVSIREKFEVLDKDNCNLEEPHEDELLGFIRNPALEVIMEVSCPTRYPTDIKKMEIVLRKTLLQYRCNDGGVQEEIEVHKAGFQLAVIAQEMQKAVLMLVNTANRINETFLRSELGQTAVFAASPVCSRGCARLGKYVCYMPRFPNSAGESVASDLARLTPQRELMHHPAPSSEL